MLIFALIMKRKIERKLERQKAFRILCLLDYGGILTYTNLPYRRIRL